MEKETNILHLLTTHQIVLFIIGCGVVFLFIFAMGALLGRYAERKRQQKNQK